VASPSYNAIWIDENSDPNYSKLGGQGFKQLFFAHRDPRLTTFYLDHVRNKGYTPGIYWASTWDAGQSADFWVNILDGTIKRLGKMPVQVNIEEHNPSKIADFITRFRKIYPWIPLSLATEGFQGGWLAQNLVLLDAQRVTLVPEAYDGAMNPYDTDGVVQDLVGRGFLYDRVVPFHDAASLRRGWRGFAFTQNRLP
jgi:hypothetical protein